MPQIVRATIGNPGPARAHEARFGRHHYPRSYACRQRCQCTTKEALVMPHVGFAQTVAVRRIDKTDALIDGMMNDLDGGYFVGPCLR